MATASPTNTGCEATKSPLVFISHDARDAKLARELSALIRTVSTEQIQVFRSSDREGQEGIPIGVEWYNFVCNMISQASDVITVFTARSIDNPWIFWEAGVAKGKGKDVNVLAFHLSLNDALKGPFAQEQICLADKSGLNKWLTQLLQRRGLRANQLLLKTAITKFLQQDKKFSSETGTGPVDAFLQPDPEVAETLRTMGLMMFAVDGMIEVCKSLRYSGWAKANVAPPAIVEQRALPKEFTDFKGADARNDVGSQSRYSLRYISEPLLDGGPAKIETKLARSRYADVFRLSRLLDRPFIKKSGQVLTGRALYGCSWYPLEKSPLIHNVNTQPIILTQDDEIILAKRSTRVDMYPGCWSASIEEQMIAPADNESTPETYFDCAHRGVVEELGCTPDPKETRILSVGIEYSNLSASFLCAVRVKETFAEVSKKWLCRAYDPYEICALDCLPLGELREIENALRLRDYTPRNRLVTREPGTRTAAQAKWHPTARMRLYALLCHMKLWGSA